MRVAYRKALAHVLLALCAHLFEQAHGTLDAGERAVRGARVVRCGVKAVQ
jgi:hypothetical protein